jgi:hypothetical protein
MGTTTPVRGVSRELWELRLWPGSLWVALLETPSKYAKEEPGTQKFLNPQRHFFKMLTDVHVPTQAVDTPLPPSSSMTPCSGRLRTCFISTRYSVRLHMYRRRRQMHGSLRTAWLYPVGQLAQRRRKTTAAFRTHYPSSSRLGSGHSGWFDARGQASECLKEVGRELGAMMIARNPFSCVFLR